VRFKNINALAERLRLPCVFRVGEGGALPGVFLGFWSDEFANVEVGTEEMKTLRLMAEDEGTDDFEMVREVAPGRFALVGDYAVQLISIEASEEQTATLLHSLASDQ